METLEMLKETTAATTLPERNRDIAPLATSGSVNRFRGLLRAKIAAVGRFCNKTMPPEERAGAFLLMANMFLVLTAYYVLKTIREALILTEGGAEIKAYSAAIQSALLLFAIPLYSRVAAKLRGFRLIATVTLFFASHLLVFSAAIAAGYHVGIAFYLWLGVFSVVVMSQIWAFASDVYTEAQGIRLFPVIGIGGALGAVAGARIASKVAKSMGMQGEMLVAAAVLLGSLGLTWLAMQHIHSKRPAEAKPLAKSGVAADGFKLILRSRYLMLIAASMVLLNLVNTGGEYVVGKMVVEQSKALGGSLAVQRQFIAGFYGSYLAWAGAVGLLLQTAMSMGALRLVGIRGALMISPLVALSGYGSIAALPLLATAFVVKVIENGPDYSVQNTVRHALFLPTNPQDKYQAQTAIETFFYRAGDMVTAVLVFAAAQMHLAPRYFAIAIVAASAVWLMVNLAIATAHARATAPKAEREAPHYEIRPSRTRGGWLAPTLGLARARQALGVLAVLVILSRVALAQEKAKPAREPQVEGRRAAKAAMLAPEDLGNEFLPKPAFPCRTSRTAPLQ